MQNIQSSMSNQGHQYAFQPAYPSAPSPPSQGHSPPASGSYIPTSFDGPHAQGIPPEQFYGSLLDAYGKPTEVFCRLVDALFFHMDHNCDVPGLKGTGVVEPSKYIWMSMRMGASEQSASVMLIYLQSFYETAGIPFQFAQAPNGQQIPILDRRAFLHCAVFEAKAAPEEAYKHWTRAITLFSLRDPMSSLPFPTPLPRSALPYFPDLELSTTYSNWRTQTMITAMRARSNARMSPMMSGYRRQSLFSGFGQGPMGSMSYLGGGIGMGASTASSLNSGGSGSGSSNSGDHATWKDTATAVANLANTVIGAATGTGGVGSLGGAGFGAGF